MSTPEQVAAPAVDPVLPAPVVGRMPAYLSALAALDAVGVGTVSSENLARACGLNSAVVRRDLSHVNFTGRRGVGYAVAELRATLEAVMGLDRTRTTAIIGAGRLGSALARYRGIPAVGYEVRGVFDVDPDLVGTSIGDTVVEDMADLRAAVRDRSIELAILTVPGEAAQAVGERVVGCGITGILSFAPTVLDLPESVHVRHVDVATELQVLGYYTARHGGIADRHPEDRKEPQ